MTRFERLQVVFEDIEWDYSFIPNEEIVDESKIDEYIENFVEYSKKKGFYEYFNEPHNKHGGKSYIELLNEI